MKNQRHGLSKHKLYNIWYMMIDRCTNEKHLNYPYYGARGIKVCDRWHNVANFIEDMFFTYKEGLSIDRINPYGNYEPNNCRWESKSTQVRNTRKIRANNKSGYRGVSWDSKINKWHTQIMVNKKTIHLGFYEDKEYAAKVYDTFIISNNLIHTRNF